MNYIEQVDYANYLAGRTAVIAAADFGYYARLATRELKTITFGTIDETATIPDDVKYCTCEIAEYFAKQDTLQGTVKSETIGKVSTTYVTAEVHTEAKRHKKAYEIACRWLTGTDYMYRGL